MATDAPVSPADVEERHRTPPAPPPFEPPRKRRLLRRLVWLLVLGAVGFGVYRIYTNLQASKQKAAAAQARASAPRAVPVVAVPAHSGDLPVYLRGLGTVTPLNTVVVKSRVDGQLMSIHYTEGQFVQKGQLLAEIDPRPFQVQLQQAEGQLARDMAQLNDAKANLTRYEYLWKQQIIAKQQLDTQAASVGQYEGVIEADKAAINNAKLQLTYASVTSPLSGRIGLRQVDVGNIVHASDANGLATIAQMQPIAVLFTIPADNLPPVLKKLRAGTKLPVYAYDRDDVNRIATGVLLTVDNQIDPQTGTSRLKAQFPNSDMALFPNQFVNCRLLLDAQHGLTLIPAAAIQHGPQGTFVFVVQNGVVHVRTVSVSLTESGDAAVQGVKAGELVVTDGQDKLQDAAKVAIQGSGGGGRGAGAGGRGQHNRPPAAAPQQPPPAGAAGQPSGAAGQQVTPGPAAPRAPGAGQPAHRTDQEK